MSRAVHSHDIDNYDDEMKNVFRVVGPSTRRDIKRVILNKAVLSSPNLQMFLYYHFFFSLAYTWFFALSYRWKYLNYADGGGLRVNFFTPAFFTVWAIAEASRIYVGYLGNLKEDTPNMAAFLFLSVFPQFFITLYMLAIQQPLFGFDVIFGWIHMCFMIVEFAIGWRTMGVFIQDKTARFSVEYGAVDSHTPAEDRTEVLALEDYINDGGMDAERNDEDATGLYDAGADEAATARAEARRLARGESTLTRAASTLPLTPSKEELELIAPRRDSFGRSQPPPSFGGPSATPISHAAIARGTVAALAAFPNPFAPAAHMASAASTGTLPPLLSRSSTLARENETAEERARRRARDRAIIEGRIVPERRRDQEEQESAAELELARAQLAASQQLEADRLATSRPMLAPLTSTQGIRIPQRAELSGAGAGSAAERQALKRE